MYTSVHDCRSPAPLTCLLQGACTVSLLSEIVVPDCFYKYADYIVVEYRFIPRKSFNRRVFSKMLLEKTSTFTENIKF